MAVKREEKSSLFIILFKTTPHLSFYLNSLTLKFVMDMDEIKTKPVIPDLDDIPGGWKIMEDMAK